MMSDTEKLLNIIAKQLGGKLLHYECSDLRSQHKKYVIEYRHQEKSK